MATILLVEDLPDLGSYEARVLERAGHRILRCSGGPSLFTACPLLKHGRCELVSSADLILFSVPMFSLRGRTYRGEHLLHAYRSHPDYGRLPMVVVSIGTPPDLPGDGRVVRVDKFSSPTAVIDAIDGLLPGPGRSPAPAGSDRPAS